MLKSTGGGKPFDVNKFDGPDVGAGFRVQSGKRPIEAHPSDFIVNTEGNDVFGEISEGLAQKIKRQPGLIKLPVGDAERGFVHIEGRRGTTLREQGYSSSAEFVADIINNCEEVRLGGGGSLMLVKRIHPKKNAVTYIELLPDKAGGVDYYRVNTAQYANDSQVAKNKLLDSQGLSANPASAAGPGMRTEHQFSGDAGPKASRISSLSDPNIPPSGQNINTQPPQPTTMADQTAAALELGAKRGWTKEQLREANRLMRNAEVNKRQVHFEDAGDGNLYLFAHGGPNKNFAKWKITPDGSNYQFRWTKPRERIGKEEQELLRMPMGAAEASADAFKSAMDKLPGSKPKGGLIPRFKKALDEKMTNFQRNWTDRFVDLARIEKKMFGEIIGYQWCIRAFCDVYNFSCC